MAAAFVEAIGGAVPTWEVVFFRSAVAAACMVPLIRRAGGWSVLRTRRPLGHAWRLLSAPRLRERGGADRGLALAAGLVGVLLVLRPWQESGGLPLTPALVVVAGVVFWALATVSIRRMGRSGERSITVVPLFTLGSGVVSGLLCIPAWVVPAGRILAALIGLGALSAVAELLMTEGYWEFAGIAVLVLSGLYAWRRAGRAAS